MDEQTYYREVIAINSANLAANLENVNINHTILNQGRTTDEQIIYLLKRILEVIERDSK